MKKALAVFKSCRGRLERVLAGFCNRYMGYYKAAMCAVTTTMQSFYVAMSTVVASVRVVRSAI